MSIEDPGTLKHALVQREEGVRGGPSVLMLAALYNPATIPSLLEAIASLPIKDQAEIYSQLEDTDKEKISKDNEPQAIILMLNTLIHEKLADLKEITKTTNKNAENPADALLARIEAFIKDYTQSMQTKTDYNHLLTDSKSCH